MNYQKFKFTDSSYIITKTVETYGRTDSGKTWKNRPDEITTENVSPEHYTNYITAVPFFDNFGGGAYCRAVNNYTVAGFLPVRVVTVSPDQQIKKVAVFSFKSK
jgi:hypothetical protein